MKVCIDAGHGGKDSGAVGVNGRMEKDDTLRTALALQKEMQARGHEVLMTRTGDTYPALNERADLANRWGAGVFVSLHRNSYGDPSANGGEVLYGRSASKTSVTLAEAINARMNAAAGFRNRGAKRQGATVLERTKMPAVTVEAGFVTSVLDNSRFDNNFNAVVRAVADSLEAVFGAEKAPFPEPDSDPYTYELAGEAPLYRYVGRGKRGTPVTLEAYPVKNEPDGVFAQVKDADGDVYLVEWANLKKA